MTSDLWHRLNVIVPEALDCAAEDRAAFLDRTCRTASGEPDSELREEVEAMIASAESAEATGALLSPVLGTTATVAQDERLSQHPLPTRIGPWKIDGVLGEGGMGIVYRAHRDDGAFDREVALKRLRPGLAPQLGERLRSERRILAGLDHPAIARLYDGGVDDTGVPYLVMEYVPGETVTAYANRMELNVRDRVRLGLAVADAVAYAHRHLVVHRDVKPSNVLVTAPEPASRQGPLAEPQVKLLDFGLAKLLDSTIDSTLTVYGAMTPAYAAPEQVRGERVTTATDVYALGVLLHELLVGERPYGVEGLSPADAVRQICETTVPVPSTIASPEASRILRGDLDGILLRALEKDPRRRYASADGLADDLRRWLNGLPVTARVPTLGYLASRFVRRHRVAVVGAVVLLVVAAGFLAAHAIRLQAERDRAIAAEAEATDQAERAEAIAGFLEDILRAPNDRWYVDVEAKGPDTPVRAVLDEAAARIERDFADRPDLRADLHHVLGDTYMGLGMADNADIHHRTVLAIRESLYTPPHPKLAEALYYVGIAEANVAQQVDLLERSTHMLRQRPGGNNFPFILNTLAARYLEADAPSLAEARARESYEAANTTFTPGSDGFRYRTLSLKYSAGLVARALLAQNKADPAERWLPTDDLCGRGKLHLTRNEPLAAERSFTECLTTTADTTVAWVLEAEVGLFEVYSSAGRREEASVYSEQADQYYAWRDSMRRALSPTLRLR